MTPDELSQLGIIATRFTPLEMGDLNLTNIDTVYSLAQYGNWSMEQVRALYLKDHFYHMTFSLAKEELATFYQNCNQLLS